MNLVEFLQDISLKGVKLWCDGEKLRTGGSQEVLTPDVISQLKQYKTQILQLLQEQPDILQVYPLSYGQRGLRFLWELAPESYTYNLSFAVRIYSQVELAILQQTFEVLKNRHPMLRSTFPKLGQEMVRQVLQNQPLDFLEIDASSWNEDELYTNVLETHRLPFALESKPVMRIRWFASSEKDHILLLTIHHIAWDGWSMSSIVKEIPEIYEAQKAGVEVSLPQIKFYQDYVNWQKELLAGSEGERLWNYWQQKLAGDLPVLNLLTDKPRPPIQTYNGAAYPLKLPQELTEQLKALAQEAGATLYMVLLAAFQILLSRYTSQEDILVGSPTFGRSKPEFVPIVGYFVDQVVMRGNLSGNPCFKDFLSQVRQTVIEGLAHQDYPFSLLVQRLQLEQDSSRSPLFQAYFILQNFQGAQNVQKMLSSRKKTVVNWGKWEVEPFALAQYESLFDLTLELIEEDSSMQGFLKYNTDIFDEHTIARMASNYQTLLAGIVHNPQENVGQLPLLGDAQQQQLLGEWNNTAAEYPQDKCMHQLFEEQVKQTPDAVALIFGDRRLTYKELNERANQLAHYLQSLEVKAEVLVGLCIDRSIEMLVGLLGILKAGGAYVPIDPSYPQQRLAYMLEDSAVPVLVTTESLLEIIPEHQAKTVCLDRDWQAIASHSQENLERVITPENRAYVIYTSGSTGKPKGVEINHYSLVNFLVSMNSYLELTNLDTFNAITTISFDIAALELYLPLIVGASVGLVPREIAIDGNRLLPQLLESGATVMQATPATWKMLLTVGLSNHKLDMKLLSGGEALPAGLAHQLLEIGKELWNVYGPTESTIWSTIYNVGDRLQSTKDSHVITPIGRPLGNTDIYILDSYLQPVPIGVPGELHIGGTGLARGYLKRPELTQERFIPNPFGQTEETNPVGETNPVSWRNRVCGGSQSRIYKTGDLARYLPDGNIEYLGRIDNQVKIRGFRIELGEIESTLTKHPEVQEAVVITHPDRLIDKPLIAYIVPNFQGEDQSSRESINQAQSERLLLWQQLRDKIYEQTIVDGGANFNPLIWRDSYTGEPFPEEDMCQWLDYTIERIGKPERVLEIGCGTGMLLFKIAPHTSKYYGTDISEKAISYVEEQLKTLEGDLSHVQVYNQPANDFKALEQESFDAVILNSVVQYFPSIEYLVGILENAIKLVEPGGTIFIGDVRSLRLLETFHTDLLLSQAADEQKVEDLWQRVQKKLKEEDELVIDPDFFQALQQYLPQISQVEIQLKRSRADNEITKFRYDVILHIGKEVLSPSGSPELLNWQQEELTLLSVQEILAEKQPEMLIIKDIPNARLQTQVQLEGLLKRKNEFVKVEDLREALAKTNKPGLWEVSWIEPEDFWNLADKLAYKSYITWSDINADCYDVVFWQKSIDSEPTNPVSSDSEPTNPVSSDSEPTNPVSSDSEPTNPVSSDSEPTNPVSSDSEPTNPVSSDSEPTNPVSPRNRVCGGYNLPPLPRENSQPKPWTAYSNNPLQSKLSQQLVPKLRTFMEQVLPQYMIPSTFVLLDSLPLTPNGKVDRKKLPNPNINRSQTEYVVPKSETEQQIAKVWQELLQLERVGIYDNFFEVGGNSLLLMQVSGKLREIFKIDLQVVTLLKYPTIYYLSQYIKGENISNNGSKETRNIRDSNLKEGKSMMKQRLERRQKHRSRNQVKD